MVCLRGFGLIKPVNRSKQKSKEKASAVTEELPDGPYFVYAETLKVNSRDAEIPSRGKCPHIATFDPYFRGHA